MGLTPVEVERTPPQIRRRSGQSDRHYEKEKEKTKTKKVKNKQLK
jgi:hypothetical protein